MPGVPYKIRIYSSYNDVLDPIVNCPYNSCTSKNASKSERKLIFHKEKKREKNNIQCECLTNSMSGNNYRATFISKMEKKAAMISLTKYKYNYKKEERKREEKVKAARANNVFFFHVQHFKREERYLRNSPYYDYSICQPTFLN